MAEVGSMRAKARWLVMLAMAGVTGALLAGAAPAVADPPANDGIDCQPYEATPCLMPFPNDLYTKKDKKTAPDAGSASRRAPCRLAAAGASTLRRTT